MKKIKKIDRFLSYLQEKGSVTSWDAIDNYNITNVSSYIQNLRKQGHIIDDEWVMSINRYGNICEFKKYTYIGKVV